VVNTANALNGFVKTYTPGTPGDTRLPEQVFKDVMVGANNWIEVDIESTATNCITNQTPGGSVVARITCYPSVTAFAFIHELGHVFIKRTGQQTDGTTSFYGLVHYPVPNRAPRRVDVAGIKIFGELSWSLTPPPQTPLPLTTPHCRACQLHT
jgi:hypothetical protein